jgi:hypothetical protein
MSRVDNGRRARGSRRRIPGTALALAHDLRLERALAIARGLDRHRPVLAHKRLRRRAVARVAGPARRLVTALVAQWSVTSADIARSTSRRVRSASRPAGPDDLLLAAGAGEHLVDQLIREPATNPGASSASGRPCAAARRASARCAATAPAALGPSSRPDGEPPCSRPSSSAPSRVARRPPPSSRARTSAQ